ncbi:MAG: ATP-binding protein, partial [Nitrospinaceae bacterium]|nr:ATP-binding protein [Nitrospinaceae bacterium]NIR55215.1 ATP-binding protein [Nitrospinaceae bacterium]NIS85642.1 ATP-binding protein [Nitrospinaceae bacterium]NIT82487.1 ATP-binding protein [Nitrospinaceae bacterium]NIU44692.1 ATP-binding protein [Nitrospinaceae bacterium]
QPTFDEYIILLLALAPHVQPGLLDATVKPFLKDSQNFPEIGGTRDNENRV